MKLRKIFLTCLLISLLTRTTRATNLDTQLAISQPAPFAGVLIDSERYRSLAIDHLEAKDFRDNLNNYVVCPDTGPTVSLFSADGYAVTISLVVIALMGGYALGANH